MNLTMKPKPKKPVKLTLNLNPELAAKLASYTERNYRDRDAFVAEAITALLRMK